MNQNTQKVALRFFPTIRIALTGHNAVPGTVDDRPEWNGRSGHST